MPDFLWQRSKIVKLLILAHISVPLLPLAGCVAPPNDQQLYQLKYDFAPRSPSDSINPSIELPAHLKGFATLASWFGIRNAFSEFLGILCAAGMHVLFAWGCPGCHAPDAGTPESKSIAEKAWLRRVSLQGKAIVKSLSYVLMLLTIITVCAWFSAPPMLTIAILVGASALCVLLSPRRQNQRLWKFLQAFFAREHLHSLVAVFVLFTSSLSYARLYYRWCDERELAFSAQLGSMLQPHNFREAIRGCRAIQEQGARRAFKGIEDQLLLILYSNPTGAIIDRKVGDLLARTIHNHEHFEAMKDYRAPDDQPSLASWISEWQRGKARLISDIPAEHVEGMELLQRETAMVIGAVNQKRTALQAKRQIGDLRAAVRGILRDAVMRAMTESLSAEGVITEPCSEMDEQMHADYEESYGKLVASMGHCR